MRAGRQLEREEVMRKILAALLCCWFSQALAQTAQELIDNPKNSENATTFGMGYHLNQYSPLNQINKSNVKRLVPIRAPGEPGSETWPKDIPYAWKYGGGATWQNGSYDPELDLVYWGTGNAEPYNPAYRGGLDSLYTASVLAIRPKTGELVWHYQYMPNESFDLDGSAEPVIAELTIDGQVRKVLMSANKNGFLYLIDRTNGALIAAHPYVKVNWASHIDSETGRPVLTDVYDRAARGETVEVWPSRGTNATLMAFNPKAGLVYLNSWEIGRILKYVKF